jgi:uncharacterized membrane protein
MRFQFGVRSLLLVTAFVALTLAGLVTEGRVISFVIGYPGWRLNSTFESLVIASPLWLPMLIAAYAIGRRSLSAKMLTFLIISECAAITGVYFRFVAIIESNRNAL